MQFSKWHGLGNDYLLVERAELAFPLTPERVRRLCDYHFGVGSDGIVEVTCANGGRAEVVIWNPDGSTAELSGNGTRIAARWLARRSGAGTVRISVGPREVVASMRDGKQVEMDMGTVEVGDMETIVVAGEPVELVPVSVGNPHGTSFYVSARSSSATSASPSGRTCNSCASMPRARSRSGSGSGGRGRPFPRARARSRSRAPRSGTGGARAPSRFTWPAATSS